MKVIDQKMQEGIEKGVYPGAALWVGLEGRSVHEGYYGWGCLTPETIRLQKTMAFDWASLTKPLATTCIVMSLMDRQEISLDRKIKDWFSEKGTKFHGEITLQHLLEHSSGLPAWRPYFEAFRKEGEKKDREALKRELLGWILKEPLLHRPGTSRIYSDLGFILLQIILEQETSRSLDQLFQERVVVPLDLKEVGYQKIRSPFLGKDSPLQERLQQFVATEYCPWRQRLLCGEVHDDHAAFLEGVAGHAGLFGTLGGAISLIEAIRHAYQGDDRWISPSLVRDFLGPQRPWALGWDRPEENCSQAGQYFSRNSIGHLGFTGCSVWVDWEKDWQVILLTNRIHPTRDNDQIKGFRPKLHDAIYEIITKKN